jgi:hypothetical protein
MNCLAFLMHENSLSAAAPVRWELGQHQIFKVKDCARLKTERGWATPKVGLVTRTGRRAVGRLPA